MLDQYANLAEIVGVLIIIVTLVFLTLQIQQNTKALRSTTIQATLQTELDLATLLAKNAGLWEKVLTAAPLASGEETRKAIILYSATMLEAENRYHQSQSGFLAPEAWEGRLGTLPKTVSLPVFNLWRTSIGASSRSTDFRELLDDLVRKSSDEQET